MNIIELSTRFENRKKVLQCLQENMYPRLEDSSFDQDVGTARTRRLKRKRKKRNTRKENNAVNDGFLGDDEYEPETRLYGNMSSNASISQQSGLTGFSDCVEFSPNSYSEDAELFNISREVDVDSLVNSYIGKRTLRDQRYYRPRRRRYYHQGRRSVSEYELGRHCHIGSSTAYTGDQYHVPDRGWFVDVGLENVRDVPPENSFFPVSRSQVNDGILCERSPADCYLPSGVFNNQRTRAWSEPLNVPTPSSSDDLDEGPRRALTRAGKKTPYGRPRLEHDTTAERHLIPSNDHDGDQGDFSGSIEGNYQYGLEPNPMQWDSGESSMKYQDVFDEGGCTWLEPQMTRENQRSFSVPEIVIEESLFPVGKSTRDRRSHSLGCEINLDSESRLKIPGLPATRIIPPSTRTGLLSLRKDLSNQDLRTAVLIGNTHQSTGVLYPLLQEYVDIHNKGAMRRSDQDSCYGSQSDRSSVRLPRRQLLEHSRFSSDGNLASCSASGNCDEACSEHHSSEATSSRLRPTFVNVDGNCNDAYSEHHSREEISIEMESQAMGEPELTVHQRQGDENQERASSGHKAYIRLIKCVVITVILFIVMICVVVVTSREDY